MPNFLSMCPARSRAVHVPDSNPQLRGPETRSSCSASSCSGPSLLGAPALRMSYLPSGPICMARMSQSRTVEYDLLSAPHICRMDIPSLRIAYASSLSAALGSFSSLCIARRRSLEVPARNLLSACIWESLAFMHCVGYGLIWILRKNNVDCLVSVC